MKKKSPELIDLKFLKFGDDDYRLLPMLVGKYEDIAATLGLEEWKMEVIKRKPFNERIDRVFMHWVQNAGGLKRHDYYPYTWQGLANILKDSQLIEIRNKFFDFLNKHA